MWRASPCRGQALRVELDADGRQPGVARLVHRWMAQQPQPPPSWTTLRPGPHMCTTASSPPVRPTVHRRNRSCKVFHHFTMLAILAILAPSKN
eukprot:1153580-Pelagomonas_calceolata.AAC.5